ncbi:MAG: hypothetical protein JWM57_2314 [Phycisphaerales bacterium]|nr:hypothetical protein [Phycisphaerales bacterium]
MLLESLERRALFAAAYGQILQDINPGTGSSLSAGSNPSIAFNGKTYFAATGYSGGSELYATDGTAAGTGRVADLAYGDASSHPRDFVISGGKLFFIADWSSQYGNQALRAKLFVSDGTTAGTHVVEYDPNTFPQYDLYGTITEPADGPTLVAYNGKVAFAAHGAHPYYYVDNTDTSLLWVSDGTVSGTSYKFVSGASSASSVTNITVAGSNLFFAIKTPGSYDSVGRYDGSDIQSTIVTTFYGQQSVGNFIAVGSSVYFRTSGSGPYDNLFYKASASGSISTSVDPYLRLSEWATVNGRLFASGTYTYDGSVPQQAWLYEIVDSPNGLQALLLGNSSQPYASPTDLTVIDHFIYYDAPDFNSGRSIIRFDPANDSFTFVGYGFSSLSGASADGAAFVKGPDGAVYVNGSTSYDAGLYRLSATDSYFQSYPINV